MREIKFRGKTLNSKVWIYGGYCKDASGYDCILTPIKGGHVFNPVIPETVGQFTGLKDSKGCEIYDDDIVSCDDDSGVVVWTDNLTYEIVSIDGEDEIICDLALYLSGTWEIIGNIYDNKELLKWKEQH